MSHIHTAHTHIHTSNTRTQHVPMLYIHKQHINHASTQHASMSYMHTAHTHIDTNNTYTYHVPVLYIHKQHTIYMSTQHTPMSYIMCGVCVWCVCVVCVCGVCVCAQSAYPHTYQQHPDIPYTRHVPTNKKSGAKYQHAHNHTTHTHKHTHTPHTHKLHTPSLSHTLNYPTNPHPGWMMRTQTHIIHTRIHTLTLFLSLSHTHSATLHNYTWSEVCAQLFVFTATYCNILQHTATHCNTLLYTATHCNSWSEVGA